MTAALPRITDALLLAQGRPWGLAFGLLGIAVVVLVVGLVALAMARRGR